MVRKLKYIAFKMWNVVVMQPMDCDATENNHEALEDVRILVLTVTVKEFITWFVQGAANVF